MKILHFEDLSAAKQKFVKKHIANGCGAKGSFFNPPDYVFNRSACVIHDFDFWVGGDKARFHRVNKKFYINMIANAKEAYNDNSINYLEYLWVKSAAWRYYKAVDLFGMDAFNLTDVPNGKNELYFLMKHKKSAKKFKADKDLTASIRG
jgi:hypothetical protein